MAYRYHRFSFYVPFFFFSEKSGHGFRLFTVPYFLRDRLDIPRLTVTAILIFKCTEGAGVGDYSSSPLSSFDTHARWQPVTRKVLDLNDLRGKMILEDCEQSRSMLSYFFSTKKKKERKRSCPSVAIDQHAFGVSYSRWRQQRLSGRRRG